MSRERRLLLVVAILAPIVEGLMLATWYQPDLPQRAQLLDQYTSCKTHLLACYEAHAPRACRVPPKSI